MYQPFSDLIVTKRCQSQSLVSEEKVGGVAQRDVVFKLTSRKIGADFT